MITVSILEIRKLRLRRLSHLVKVSKFICCTWWQINSLNHCTSSLVNLLDCPLLSRLLKRTLGNTRIIVHQAAPRTKGFTLTLFFVSSPFMKLPKLLRNRSEELSWEQRKPASAEMVHGNNTTLGRAPRLPCSWTWTLKPLRSKWPEIYSPNVATSHES